MRRRVISKVGLAAISDNALLLVRKRGTSSYILPGGKPELDENDVTALEREIHEELDCSINEATLKYLGTFSDRGAHNVDAIVKVKLYNGELIGLPRPCSEIEEITWFRCDDTVPLAPSLNNKIIPFLLKKGYLSLGSVANEIPLVFSLI